MLKNRSAVNNFSLKISLGFILTFVIRFSLGITDPSDVAAINSLYVSLGSPTIPGWVASGGDPCGGENWQGVDCDGSSISSITLIGANLGGELGDGLSSFSSIKSITLSNNLIGGSIPSDLPATLTTIFLSDNKLTGSIPSSLSSLTNLSAMSLNNNELTGEIPDSFEDLPILVNLDLFNNNLSGELPPSMQNLSSLTTLHLQNNQLSGTLDVLQDLPLKDLDIQNNQFNGPIPAKLLSIPNFRDNGNPFNASTAPLPSPSSSGGAPPPEPPPFFPGSNSSQPKPPPSSSHRPSKQPNGSSSTTSEDSNSTSSRKSSKTKRIVWISIASVLCFIVLVLAILLFMPRCTRERREAAYRTPKRHEIAPYNITRDNNNNNNNNNNARESGSTLLTSHDVEKASAKEENRTRSWASKQHEEEDVNKLRTSGALPRRNQSGIDSTRFDIDIMPPPPPPPLPPSPPPPPPRPPLPFSEESEITSPVIIAETSMTKPVLVTSVRTYTIASLQQYTNSFSQENLIGSGMLGNVYRAELPNGKFLAVKKLDKRVTNQLKDEQFIELVNNLDTIRHANVVELMGYCSEHGQRLLVYEYCSNGTLLDALHSDDEFKRKLSWNTRIRMALGVARALEYLHEVCEPPAIHRNFKSANVLLDDELSVLVSDCGLAPLITSGAVSQLSGQLLTTYGYGAPEFESGVYTSKSDVYSFGVVMLELLTGRESYDRSRPRGEQFLVRWAIPQLHDIDALSGMVDPVLGGKYPVKSLSHFADIISRCVLAEPEFRPVMSEVVQDIMQLIRRESPNRSEVD